MVQRPQKRVLTGPDLKAFSKALANPVRRDILSYLGKHGEANSTSVAKALGESTGTTSYHLRKLADLDLITELEDRGDGRERWWKSQMKDIYTPPGLELTPDEREAALKLGAMKMSHDLGLVTRAYAGYDSAGGWNQIYRSGLHLTKEQIASFVEEYQNLVWKYVTEPGQHPEGSRAVAVRLIVVPEEDESTKD
ncbi:DNA-binding transcriptional ArsR family regulator [Amycolatopsis lexingtonensis]|uniref:DNA-binding transcriptional ArsR family regulator n=1 Tax=Amycolatopsis lexingtonensis TaxID=218822 RepID=A0ABR9IBY0_9PSEU|nr:winged helix-turn-helix domain-containing protein [Amycolatopsis lexingtonensis]MBE1500686.1 DNA-binding transcriptional ArsR family regulator [Amycolatopsis lexingtonensis]